jgi:hypothetical protein
MSEYEIALEQQSTEWDDSAEPSDAVGESEDLAVVPNAGDRRPGESPEDRNARILEALGELGILVVDLRRGGSGPRPRSTVGLPQPAERAPVEQEEHSEPVEAESTGTASEPQPAHWAASNREDRIEKVQPAEKDRLAGDRLDSFATDQLPHYPVGDHEDELRYRADRLGIELTPDNIHRLLNLADEPDLSERFPEPEPILRRRGAAEDEALEGSRARAKEPA